MRGHPVTDRQVTTIESYIRREKTKKATIKRTKTMTDSQVKKRNKAFPSPSEEHDFSPGSPTASDRAAIAMDLVAMFLHATSETYITDCKSDDMQVAARELSPKERSLYHAAVEYLERLLD